MLFEEIKALVDSARAKKIREGYIIYLIKEYLQNIVLEYIYGHKDLNRDLVFTGGTCLRFCFNLPRLSEDLDFDCAKAPDYHSLAKDLKTFFRTTLKYEAVDAVVKGREQKVYLKFPFLRSLGLNFNESFILLLKIEIARASLEDCSIETSLVEKGGRTYFLRRYSLSDLMAGKVHAFLTRMFFKGQENEIDFKGRDMYDLVWYMGKNIQPNVKRLPRLFRATAYAEMSWPEMLAEINQKAKKIKKSHIRLDLINFIENASSLDNFLDNYLSIIDQYVKATAADKEI